jgi:hypothetical protein
VLLRDRITAVSWKKRTWKSSRSSENETDIFCPENNYEEEWRTAVLSKIAHSSFSCNVNWLILFNRKRSNLFHENSSSKRNFCRNNELVLILIFWGCDNRFSSSSWLLFCIQNLINIFYIF